MLLDDEADKQVVALIAGFIIGVVLMMFVMTTVFERWRPKVIEWDVTITNQNRTISTTERPKKVVWDSVIYDCVESPSLEKQ